MAVLCYIGFLLLFSLVMTVVILWADDKSSPIGESAPLVFTGHIDLLG
jgi:hypothetical protein